MDKSGTKTGVPDSHAAAFFRTARTGRAETEIRHSPTAGGND